MEKVFRVIGIVAVVLALEVPPAQAIFGIRAARTAIAARRAEKMSHSKTADQAAAQTEQRTDPSETAKNPESVTS